MVRFLDKEYCLVKGRLHTDDAIMGAGRRDRKG
jgi:hypothetical protein